jgi:hypothetical protein
LRFKYEPSQQSIHMTVMKDGKLADRLISLLQAT